jgi:hypothetical protein
VPGAEVLQTEIVARRFAHGSRRSVRSSFYMSHGPNRGQGRARRHAALGANLTL